MSQSILVIDDEPTVRSLFIEFLAGAGFEVHAVSTLGTGRDALSSRSFDAVIIDQTLPDGRGTDLIRELRAGSPEMAIVVMSGAGDIPLAVEAMRRGADTFLTKPVDLDELIVFLQKSLELRSLRKLSRAHQRLEQKSKPDFGTSGAMRRVMEFAGLASGNGAPVLITGETGSGKGVLARWIHENSARTAGSFVEVNCSSLRGELLAFPGVVPSGLRPAARRGAVARRVRRRGARSRPARGRAAARRAPHAHARLGSDGGPGLPGPAAQGPAHGSRGDR